MKDPVVRCPQKFCMGSILWAAMFCGQAFSEPPPNAGDATLPVASVAELASAFRSVLLQTLPDPLYAGSRGWGKTRRVATGVKWVGKGLDRHPHTRFAERNDGTWRKVRVVADRPADTLQVALPELHSDAAGRITFTASMACDVRVDYEKQRWRAGVRLYSTSIRARLRIKLTLSCEVTGKLESKPEAIVPDLVLQLHVLRADAGYDHLVVEHAAGVGGDLAKLLGKAVQEGVHRFDPRLEKKLLAKANGAIQKAADSKAVRLSLSALLKGQK